VVEAGDDTVPPANRTAMRDRFMRYGENPWGKDHLDGYEVEGPLQSRSMQVGGLAMHWGGVTPRFSPEDFRQRSVAGVGTDWPISYEQLDPSYQEAEEVLGVAGEQGPREMDPRGKPFPLPPLPLTYNLGLLKEWATKCGIATWSQPSAEKLRAVSRSPRMLSATTPARPCVPSVPSIRPTSRGTRYGARTGRSSSHEPW
jgi:choline dehydrogenase-like flavoprotein